MKCHIWRNATHFVLNESIPSCGLRPYAKWINVCVDSLSRHISYVIVSPQAIFTVYKKLCVPEVILYHWYFMIPGIARILMGSSVHSCNYRAQTKQQWTVGKEICTYVSLKHRVCTYLQIGIVVNSYYCVKCMDVTRFEIWQSHQINGYERINRSTLTDWGVEFIMYKEGDW